MDDELNIIQNEDDDVLETVEVIQVDDIEVIDAEVSEAFPPLGEDNPQLNHALLYGRDAANQHPITSIEGLRQELDDIEALKTVYSDKKHQADYYLWRKDEKHPLPANPYCLFVSIYPETNNIQICDENSDVFGVTVPDAAFVGNQEYAQADGGTKTGRDGNYALVVHSGLVSVRCETTVVVGDYVVPNSRGEAKKFNDNNLGYKYGYLVTALSEVGDVQYATISLVAPSTLAKTLADGVQDLSVRVSNETNRITSAINVANSAYALAKDVKDSTDSNIEYIGGQVSDALDKVDKIEDEVKDLNTSVENACTNAELAKTISENAVAAAKQMGDDAYASANEAIAAIKDISAGSTSWAKRVDAYSVGEYSQAYGLTWEQAKSQNAVKTGTIHIPTIVHTETYVGISDVYKQEFSIGYYYEWNGETWTPSSSVAVNFSSEYISGSTQSPYWVVKIADVEKDGVIYKLGYLYKWNNDAWEYTGASVAENTLTRAVSAMHQTANELSMEVSNVRGDVAIVNSRVDENASNVQTLAKWTGSEEGKWNIATTTSKTDDDGAHMAFVVVKDAEEDIELGGARIVLDDGENGSYIKMDADRIDFTAGDFTIDAKHISLNGETTLSSWQDENDITKINGGNIQTNTVTADKIDVDELSSISADLGIVNAGVINIIDDIIIQEPEVTGTLIYSDLQTSSDDGSNYYVVTDFSGDFKESHLEIPDFYNGYPVKIIGEKAFENCEIKSIKLGKSLVEIQSNAFKNCKNLIEIVIPDNVVTLGQYVFIGCTSLVSVTIGNGIQFLTDQQFYNCSNLKRVIGLAGLSEPNKGNSISQSTFTGCEGSLRDIYYSGISNSFSMQPFINWSIKPKIHYHLNNQNRPAEEEYWDYNDINNTLNNNRDYIINSPYFKVSKYGSIEASAGTFSGHLQAATGTFSGELKAATGSFSGTLNAASGTFKGKLQAATGTFSGELKAATGSFSGKITATSGEIQEGVTIGNCTINGDGFFSSANDAFYIGNSGYLAAYNAKFSTTVSVGTSLTCGKVNLGTESININSKITLLDLGTTGGGLSTSSGNNLNISSGQYLLITSAGYIKIGTKDNTSNVNQLLGYWKVQEMGAETPVNVTSDKNKKNTIQNQSEAYSSIFDKLKPVTFKYNDGNSDRIHTGFIAQDVEEAVLQSGLTTKDFAAVCYDTDENGNKHDYGVRYEEIVSLCVYEIQKLKARIKELETKQND